MRFVLQSAKSWGYFGWQRLNLCIKVKPLVKCASFAWRHRWFLFAISTPCSVYAWCYRLSPGTFHLQTPLLLFCILALRSDAQREAHLSSHWGAQWRGWKGVTHRGGRATGSCAAYNIVFLVRLRGDKQRFQELVVGFQVPLLMPMRYHWSLGGRQGGDTCPHQPANAKHVSSPPSAPPRENGRDLLHF